MMQRIAMTLAGCAVLALAGCHSGSSPDGAPRPEPGQPGLLSRVADTAAFETALKQALVDSTQAVALAGSVTLTSADAEMSAGAAQSAGFTGTYTLELDVDELDSVRYDGQHLFIAPRRYMRCCFILDEASSAPATPPPDAIRILATDPENAAADLVSEILLDTDISVQGMYVEGDRLFALTAQGFFGSYGQLWAFPAIWAPEKLGFQVYDVSDAANPVLEIEATIDGVFVESRRVGNIVYVVSRHTPQIDGLHYYPATAEQRAENEALLAATTLEDLLPKITLGGETRLLVEPGNCYVTTDDDSEDNPVLTSITAIPLDDPSSFTTACYSESAYGVYVSQSALYFAELRPDEALQRDVTRIHKFGLNGAQIGYRGSVDVVGTVWQGSQPDFRVSEHDGDLRVLASQFQWGAEDFVDHQLYVLRESTLAPDLEIVSTLPNSGRPEEIGKPNEALFGVRFLDDRLYAVTFEQVDPLYVIDLSDPADPFIAGELLVPGVSDFLHPVTEELLLGLGRDPDGGVKVELFDASNITQPLSRGSAVIGGPGSYSEAVHDRHAFTYQADVGGVDRFTIPVNAFAGDGSYQFLGSALHLFEIRDKTTPALAALVPVAAVEPPSTGTEPAWIERSRAFIHDDTVYYVRDEDTSVFFWHAPYVVNGPF